MKFVVSEEIENIMKKILITITIGILLQASIFAQVKIWDKKLKTKKAKGMFCILKTDTVTLKPKAKKNKMHFSSATIVGTLLPYAIKFGNYALKKATGKDENLYKHKSFALNQLVYKYTNLTDSTITFSANQYFYFKGDSTKTPASKYQFILKKNDSILNVVFVGAKKDYSFVKLKKKYDLIITNIDISIQALVSENIKGDTSQLKLMNMGTSTIYIIKPGVNFKLTKNEIFNEGSFLIPRYTDKGKEIVVKRFIISLKLDEVNPYGLTSNGLNEFFEENSETNEAILNALFIKNNEDD